jgi:hypothetical protein
MARPGVAISKGNGQIGGVPVSEDGVSALVISAKGTYAAGVTGNVFLTLKNAEDAGITQAKDASEGNLVWEHVKDFYENAPDGTKLYVWFFPDTLTLTQLFTGASAINNGLINLLKAAGDVRLLGVALNPSYVELSGTGITPDMLTALPLGQAFVRAEFSRFRPVNILLEGRRFGGTIAAATNLRLQAAESVSVVVSREKGKTAVLVSSGIAGAVNFAQLGYALGRVASLSVERSIGDVSLGALTGIATAELSGGQNLDSITDAEYDALHDKGYIFYLRQSGKPGWFFNSDPTACPLTNDYSRIALGRVIDKACRITRRVYLERVNSKVRVNKSNGQLEPIFVKTYENELRSAIEAEMVDTDEVISVVVTVDPRQNVLSTKKVSSLVELVPFGILEQQAVIVQFDNPFNS